MLRRVLQEYGFPISSIQVSPFGNGLINNTWRIRLNGSGGDFILQKINVNVFKTPSDIAQNTRLIGEYLSQQYPSYLFVKPLNSGNGGDLVFVEGEGYYRMVPFIADSHTIDVVQTPEQAFEASKQFGRFTRLLCGFDEKKLKFTIPDFHNLYLRFEHFLESSRFGNLERISFASEEIKYLMQADFIVEKFNAMRKDNDFHQRVTHHDTKISNVLFDAQNHGLCVIDLDTVMPGYFVSDVGDMMRTYLCPVSEEEKDLSKVEIRVDYYKAIVDGYLSEMEGELSEAERKSFFDAGCYLIYMQALRFMTDFLNNDQYYGERFPNQNFFRASNQISLLKQLLGLEMQLKSI